MLPAWRLAGAGQRLRPPLRTASHPRSHTLTLPRALSHTHSPPSSCSVYLLQLSGDPGEAQYRACATQSPPPPRASQPAAKLRRERPAVSRMASRPPPPQPLAPGQRLLLAAPTNLLVGESRTGATNPLLRSLDPQPVGRRESWAKLWGILGVVVFLRRRDPVAWAHPTQLSLVTQRHLSPFIHVNALSHFTWKKPRTHSLPPPEPNTVS